MNRRRFLHAAASVAAVAPLAVFGGRAIASGAGSIAASRYARLLILIELKGGNDGLNTLVPYADPAYYALRPRLAIARDSVVPLSDRAGLHPALAPLLPLWQSRQLAVLQGVGYPQPNLSHFRSIEIWDTGSSSDRRLSDGWLARTLAATPTPRTFAADAVIAGSNDPGPLAGAARTVTIADTEAFLKRAKLAKPGRVAGNAALRHVLATENDIVQAAGHFDVRNSRAFATSFPAGPFGALVGTAAHVIADAGGVAAVRLTLAGFDTHANQAPAHAQLLGAFAQGIIALKAALEELGRWDDTLIVTYAEFGRRPRENASGGTDHGTASVHFALGGRVGGGFYGAAPDLARLSAEGNVGHAIDFRTVYATVLERWWDTDSRNVLAGRFDPLPILRL